MNWDLMNKYDADMGATVGGAGGRDVILDIDTDIVLTNLSSMSKALSVVQDKLLSGFSLSGAWTSSNANLVQEKVVEINDSFAEMQCIIEELIKKLESYVTNTVEADKVTFTDGGAQG